MFKIGNLSIESRAALSPLASLTDIAFRRLVDEIGNAGYMVTGLVSAAALRRKTIKTLDLIKTFECRTPQFIQLFGTDAREFSEAVKYIDNETDFSGIDINMGCPARKVIKKGAGSALLDTPEIIGNICREIRKSTKLPITAKIRLGFLKINVFEVLKVLENEGIDAVAIHFRLKSDNYESEANWEYAEKLKEKTKMILIGNGDIFSAVEAQNKLKLLDGVMIGRGALWNPFIFSEIKGEKISHSKKKQVYKRLTELIEEYYEPGFRLTRIKIMAKYLIRKTPRSKFIRQRIYTSKSFEEARLLLEGSIS